MLGPHIIGGVSPHLDVIRRWQPRLLLLLDPSSGAARAIKQVSPGTIIIGRVWKADGEIANRITANPTEAAQWGASLIRLYAAGNPEIDYWQFANEIQQGSAAELQRLNTHSIAFVDALAAMGLRAAIGGFGVGNPKTPQENSAEWATFYPAMRHAKARGGILLIHAYGADSIFAPDDTYYLHRYEKRVLPHLPNDLKDMPYAYGEYGCDMGVKTMGDRRGWKTGYGGNWNAYGNDLLTASRFLANYPQCKGAAIFTLGQFGDWEDFDITGGCAEHLAGLAWAQPVSQPAPPLPVPVPPTPPTIERVRLRIPYASQLAPVTQSDYGVGDCLQAVITQLARASGRTVTVNDVARLTGLPKGYLSSHIITHGVNVAGRLGVRLLWAGRLEAEDLREEIRAGRSVILRVWYPFLMKRFDLNYSQYHFITVHGFEGDTFFYDDPYWRKQSDGEDIAITAAQLRRAAWRAAGGATPAQGLLVRSLELPKLEAA